MFSVQQKRDISDAVQKILRATQHAELPKDNGEITFNLHVDGAESWSWADIGNNGAHGNPGVNPHNELMASMSEQEGRDLIDEAKGKVLNVIFKKLAREDVATLLAMTKDLGHDRLVTSAKEATNGGE